ncbi:MAG: mug [Firmicutes bacterium]|nr:mug [Bacillota bacterium]
MKEVSDIIAPGLAILFIGFNPGERSALTGHHFAGHSNRFWKVLASSGLTPRQLKPDEDRLLLEYGYGITNIVARPTKAASEITKEEYRAGRLILLNKIARYQPKLACYAGIGVYKELTGTAKIHCGLQTASVVAGTLDFVVPSPSGLNRTPFAEQLTYYQELRKLTNSPLI